MPTAEQMHDAEVTFPLGSRSPEFVELYAQLRDTLDPDAWARVRKMVTLTEQQAGEREYASVWEMVDAIARHFPGFAPAIRAVAQHLIEASCSSDCGVRWDERQPAEWLPCAGPVPIDPAA